MNLPSDTPKLPKWIFLAGDVALLAAAWFIASGSAHPVTGMPLIAIVVCVAVAAVLGAVPFVADYARRQDEALDNRQRALQALAATVTSSSEQIAIAASGLDRLAGIAQENFNQSDKVAHQIQEKMAELLARLSEARHDDFEAAAKLESVAKKIAKTVAELDAASSRAPGAVRAAPPLPAVALEVPPVLASQIVEIRPAIAPSGAPFLTPAIAAQPEAVPEPPPPPPPVPVPEAAPVSEAPPVPEAAPLPAPAPEVAPAPAPPPAPEAAAPRKRAPRKPVTDTLPDLILETQPAAAPDGATRLTVTAYIGIGNRLFIRGSGPGLSWDKGVPLTFVSIGKWRWESGEATSSVKFKLYKNDEIECTSLGEGSVEPGAQQSLTASF
jgi:hypothetical protein